ncbi:MAG: hypothetical protein UW69_C0008G0026 [Microgenomates group bacterium GW2011_GWA2_44_7]|nr:MAG: hypothetical protein UW69_C0008G0026 [Microgenomates group bacterium GW2011_GWA2_44_7]
MEKDKTRESTETSETQKDDTDSSLEREIAAGEWQRLKTFITYRKRSRQGRILASYQAVTNRLNQLSTVFMQVVRNNPSGAQKLLEEIISARIYLRERG